MLNISSKIASIVSDEANVLTRNLLHEIQKAEEKFQPDKKWADEMMEVLRFTVGAGEGLTVGMAYALHIIKKHWEELPLEFRKGYNYQFDVLVMRETPIKPETFDNYERAIKTFIVEGKKPVGTVEIPKRNKFKEPVIEGEVVRENVEFDPLKIPLSKLSIMRSAVEKDQMTDKRWGMLVDPGITADQLRSELYTRPQPTDPDLSMTWYLAGDVLVVSEMGEEAVIGRLDFTEYGRNELVTNGIKRILHCLGIKLDEEVISTIQKHGFVERLYDGSSKAEDQSSG